MISPLQLVIGARTHEFLPTENSAAIVTCLISGLMGKPRGVAVVLSPATGRIASDAVRMKFRLVRG